MSALPHKADIDARDCDVRFVSTRDSCTAAIPTLFDYLVRAHKQQGWKGEADHFRCLEVDYQLYLCGQLYRKISRARAIENPCHRHDPDPCPLLRGVSHPALTECWTAGHRGGQAVGQLLGAACAKRAQPGAQVQGGTERGLWRGFCRYSCLERNVSLWSFRPFLSPSASLRADLRGHLARSGSSSASGRTNHQVVTHVSKHREQHHR